jgi:hypothetical protein
MKLSKKFIKSFISKEQFFDGTELNGISLEKNSYDLFFSNYYNEFVFRTSLSNPLIEILRENFDVIYVKPFYAHYHEFIIKQKN